MDNYFAEDVFLLNLDGTCRPPIPAAAHLVEDKNGSAPVCIEDIYPPKISRRFRTGLKKVVQTGEAVTFEYMRRAAGGVRSYAATLFPGPKGNFVFNAATIFWAQGLGLPPGHIIPWSHWSRPHGPDPRVQQITRNLLQRCQRTRS